MRSRRAACSADRTKSSSASSARASRSAAWRSTTTSLVRFSSWPPMRPRTSPGRSCGSTGGSPPGNTGGQRLESLQSMAKKSRYTRFLRALGQVGMRLRHQRNEVFYRLRATPGGYALLKNAESVLSPFDLPMRRRAAAEFNGRSARPLMTPGGGWASVGPANFAGLDRVMDSCEAVFERKLAADRGLQRSTGDSKNLLEKRKFLRNLLLDEDIRQHPELLDFALSDDALGIATSYLGVVPYLNRIDLLYSTPREGDDLIKSQLFHVDPEGLTQVKFFINVFDVGDAEGPFTFIPAAESLQVLGGIRRLRKANGQPHVGRYTDEEVAAVGGGSVVSLKGPRGSGVAIDTSKCLHLGSRVRPGAFRLVFYVQYCTTHEVNGNRFDTARYRHDPIRYLAIQHSERARGITLDAPSMAG